MATSDDIYNQPTVEIVKIQSLPQIGLHYSLYISIHKKASTKFPLLYELLSMIIAAKVLSTAI